MLTDLKKKIIAAVQGDIPVTRRPFLEIANRIGVEEATLLNVLNELIETGVIRRFGATLRHQNSGFKANAMIAWAVEEDRIDEAGQKMAQFSQVTHCYRRNPAKDWPYNLYTMIHAKDEATCRAIAQKLSEKTSIRTYEILFSRRELKKISMQYFDEDPDLSEEG